MVIHVIIKNYQYQYYNRTDGGHVVCMLCEGSKSSESTMTIFLQTVKEALPILGSILLHETKLFMIHAYPTQYSTQYSIQYSIQYSTQFNDQALDPWSTLTSLSTQIKICKGSGFTSYM